jgi:hypothetical protein
MSERPLLSATGLLIVTTPAFRQLLASGAWISQVAAVSSTYGESSHPGLGVSRLCARAYKPPAKPSWDGFAYTTNGRIPGPTKVFF